MRPPVLTRFSTLQIREIVLIVGPALVAVLIALLAATRFIEPAPPKTITITSGGESGAYYEFANRYARILARSGVRLIVEPSAGSLENIERLGRPDGRWSLALIQGGVANSKAAPDVVSLGRIFLEPLWVFYRGSESADRLAAFRGRRIAVGPEGSGTRRLALDLLAANGIGPEAATLVPLSGKAAADALEVGTVDAIFLVLAPEAPLIRDLLRSRTARLMSFAQAEAYTRRFPFLTRIVLPRGVVDLAANIPSADVEMIAPVAALVARSGTHPALIGLLVEAAKEVHAPGGLFHRIGEFPRASDPEFELSDDADRVHKNGPPFLQRYLPFWLATFIERMKILLVPLLTMIIPLAKLVPWLYRWRIKRRILYWYGRLKDLDHSFAADRARIMLEEHRAELERIDLSVAAIPVPLSFSEQYYALRAAIDSSRQRIFSGASAAPPGV
jgi:TRAP transporter TAXI family solute receptor